MEYKLTLPGIEAAVTEVEAYLTERKKDKKDVLRIRLGMEEALLRYREQFGEEKEFFLKCGKSLGRTKISISIRGNMFDPFSQPGDAESSNAFMRTALASMGDLPIWKYLNGSNEIYFTLSREALPEWAHLIFAIVSAVVLGVLLQFTSADVRSFVREDLLTPLLDAFMNLLSGIAGPMIFLAIIWGIYSIGDAATFSVLGKRLTVRYILYATILILLFFVGCLPFLKLTFGAAQGGESIFSVALRMFLQLVPTSIVEPFSSGNTLQILFLGIVMGIAMIFISEKTQGVAAFIEQLNYIVQVIMNFVGKLVPLFVFCSLMNIFLGEELGNLKNTYKLFLFSTIGCIFMLLFVTVLLAVRMKLSPIRFWKKAFSAFLIAFTTASSSAAFGTNISTCKERFGISDNLTNFGVPFGQIIFRPGTSVFYLSAALYMAESCQVPVSAAWMVTAVFMCILLGIATPPIAGGMLASLSVLFAQLSIPIDGIAVVVALSIILDFLLTPTNIIGGQAMLIIQAKSSGLLDEDILLDREK